MQVTIARQLGLEPTTVRNFFMNARRRSHDKWRDGPEEMEDDHDDQDDVDQNTNIKYEVYDCNDGMDQGYQDQFDSHMTNLGGEPQYHNMTAIPGPVHNNHTQVQHYPSTCT